jgi:hypothetical protein
MASHVKQVPSCTASEEQHPCVCLEVMKVGTAQPGYYNVVEAGDNLFASIDGEVFPIEVKGLFVRIMDGQKLLTATLVGMLKSACMSRAYTD